MGERSRENLGLSTIPLTQLHCPPDGVYENDAIFDALDEMVSDGILGAYGVSIETVAQGLRAIERPDVATVQVIFNAFRLKPLEAAVARLRKGRCGRDRPCPPGLRPAVGQVHREPRPSRPATTGPITGLGEAFDIGETFSGVPFEVGVQRRPPVGQVGRARGLDAARSGPALVRRRRRAFPRSSRAPATLSRPGPMPLRAAGPPSPRRRRP